MLDDSGDFPLADFSCQVTHEVPVSSPALLRCLSIGLGFLHEQPGSIGVMESLAIAPGSNRRGTRWGGACLQHELPPRAIFGWASLTVETEKTKTYENQSLQYSPQYNVFCRRPSGRGPGSERSRQNFPGSGAGRRNQQRRSGGDSSNQHLGKHL